MITTPGERGRRSGLVEAWAREGAAAKRTHSYHHGEDMMMMVMIMVKIQDCDDDDDDDDDGDDDDVDDAEDVNFCNGTVI